MPLLQRDQSDYPPMPRSMNGQASALPVIMKFPHAKFTDPGRKTLDRYLRNNYGIGLERYECLFIAQGGVCAICRQVSLEGEKLHVDHCHNTRRVRGLLCVHCNRGLGGFRDNADWCKRAAVYLLEDPR